ncbi:putative toxin-antitoxin system toxin component, PIN family [Desulfolutivibrio sulfoxidireducens]|uniref:putative toxin-antitoxin system toxin component, PIN family n=1 Tax=Desulfolutivibrio sulfoxidireducens TaxID=2773299 RepID=UPI00159DB9DC|nr:putative toxin-antitoxin system toxin component, PIN family [Desulfolutivibrio sulfoxidireducens]
MRLVIDCNVLIAAGWNSGTCREVLFAAIRDHAPLMSRGILDEYATVFAYSRFDHIRPALTLLRDALLKTATLVRPVPSPFLLPDPKDMIYLETALAGDAEAIITGNARHFPEPAYGFVRILTPRDFLDINTTS